MTELRISCDEDKDVVHFKEQTQKDSVCFFIQYLELRTISHSFLNVYMYM